MDVKSTVTWFGKRPTYAKILLVVAVFFLLVDVAAYAYGSFVSTRIRVVSGSLHSSMEKYEWTSGTLQLDNPSTRYTASCDIDGNNGGHHEVVVPNQPRNSLSVHRVVEVSPSSQDSVTVACTSASRDYVTARTGSSATVWAFVNSWAYRILAPALVIIPLLIWFFVRARRKRGA